jgi:hypothetical protein
VKPSTKLILLLVVVSALFVAALVLGVFINHGGNNGRPSGVDGMKRDWLKALGALSGLFAPRVDLASLRCKDAPKPPVVSAFEQRVDRPFELTAAHPTCEIQIPGDSKHDYRHAKLKVLDTTATVYVRAQFAEHDFPRAERDPSKCFLDKEPLDAFRMEVRYSDGGSAKDPWECWLKQEPNEPISVTVLKDPGRLALSCAGCKSDGKKTIRLEME